MASYFFETEAQCSDDESTDLTTTEEMTPREDPYVGEDERHRRLVNTPLSPRIVTDNSAACALLANRATGSTAATGQPPKKRARRTRTRRATTSSSTALGAPANGITMSSQLASESPPLPPTQAEQSSQTPPLPNESSQADSNAIADYFPHTISAMTGQTEDLEVIESLVYLWSDRKWITRLTLYDTFQ